MGKVYIVGAGPGDPELLTIKALKILKSADVILYDALVSKDILELSNPKAIKVFVGKREGKHSLSQDEINELLYRYSLLYKNVVRLKGGDPFIFGRGGEEVYYLVNKNVEVEVIPGISSFYSAPESAYIPLTFRGISSSFAVITGNSVKEINWNNFVNIDTIVVLMGVKKRREIAKALIDAGRNPDEDVAFIENATTPEQRTIFTNLKELSQNPPDINTPAVMVIGNVVKLGKIIGEKLFTNLSIQLQNCS